MNSSHFHSQGWTAGSSPTTAVFSELHQHLDDNSHLFDEMIRSAQLAAEQTTLPQPVKAKVLFQFFDGWPMVKS